MNAMQARLGELQPRALQPWMARRDLLRAGARKSIRHDPREAGDTRADLRDPRRVSQELVERARSSRDRTHKAGRHEKGFESLPVWSVLHSGSAASIRSTAAPRLVEIAKPSRAATTYPTPDVRVAPARRVRRMFLPLDMAQPVSHVPRSREIKSWPHLRQGPVPGFLHSAPLLGSGEWGEMVPSRARGVSAARPLVDTGAHPVVLLHRE